MRRRIALLLEYDGAGFAGSQAQSGRRTVQETLEDALCAFTGERRRIAFAGRTDAGVHATGQVAAVATEAEYPPRVFRRALNRYLPDDVAVRAAAEVPVGFDPRRDAQRRRYRYALLDGRARSPLWRGRAWHRERMLDVAQMAAAADSLPVDRDRDWAAFAGPVPEGYSTIRRLFGCRVERTAPHVVAVTVEATGFLPHQVRRMVGALERVGSGGMTPGAFAELQDGPAGSAGPTAPAAGLTLERVTYAAGMVMWDDDEDVSTERAGDGPPLARD